MKNTMTIALKELKSYLTSPMAYVITAIFLALTGTFFALSNSTIYETSIRGVWEFWGVLLLLLLASILTMRLIAEEKKLGTWELLLTAPVRDSEVILGKFLGSLAVLVGMLVLTFYYPILLITLGGDPDMGPIFTTYLGLFLLSSASLAVGIFASSLTSNQIVAAVVAGGILFGLWFIGTIGSLAPGALGEVLSYLSLSYHFDGLMKGIVDTRAIIYYLSVTALFLYLAMRSLEAGRWG